MLNAPTQYHWLPVCLQDKALRKAAKKGGSDKFGNMDPMGGWNAAARLN
jgi:hypothetical protein